MRSKAAVLFSQPFVLAFLFIIAALWGKDIPLSTAQVFYTFSILLKDLLMLFLPIAVLVYVATALKDFRKNTALVVLLIVLFEAVSNTSAVWYAYMVVNLHSFEFVFSAPRDMLELQPFFSIAFLKPWFWSPDKGVLLGVVLGIGLSYENVPLLTNLLDKGLVAVNFGLKNVFSKFIPLFAFGFLLNLARSGLLDDIISNYLHVFLVLFIALASYLAFLFLLGAGFRPVAAWKSFANTIPSGLIAFTSMSSAATMPHTIQAAERNLQNPSLARMIIPATTNIQQIGDCLINAFMCLMILLSFGKPIPSLYAWTIFSFYFVAYRYATTAMAGGAIWVMVPLYEQYLGFSPQEVSLIVALNVILDPFVTSSNVLGNGALAILLEKIMIKTGLFDLKPPPKKV